MPWPWSKRKPKEEAREEPDKEIGSRLEEMEGGFSSDAPSATRESPAGESIASGAPSAARRSPSGVTTQRLPTDEELRPAVEEKMREQLGRSPTEEEVRTVTAELRRKMSE